MSKQITIVEGLNGEEKRLTVPDNSLVSDALRAAGISVGSGRSITSFSDAGNIEAGELVRDGETYLLTSNHHSG